MLYIVDAYRDETIVHRIDYNLGRYMMPKVIQNEDKTFIGVAFEIIELIKKEENVTKIVFDKTGVGCGVADAFESLVRNPRVPFIVDANGNIIIKKGNDIG